MQSQATKSFNLEEQLAIVETACQRFEYLDTTILEKNLKACVERPCIAKDTDIFLWIYTCWNLVQFEINDVDASRRACLVIKYEDRLLQLPLELNDRPPGARRCCLGLLCGIISRAYNRLAYLDSGLRFGGNLVKTEKFLELSLKEFQECDEPCKQILEGQVAELLFLIGATNLEYCLTGTVLNKERLMTGIKYTAHAVKISTLASCRYQALGNLGYAHKLWWKISGLELHRKFAEVYFCQVLNAECDAKIKRNAHISSRGVLDRVQNDPALLESCAAGIKKGSDEWFSVEYMRANVYFSEKRFSDSKTVLRNLKKEIPQGTRRWTFVKAVTLLVFVLDQEGLSSEAESEAECLFKSIVPALSVDDDEDILVSVKFREGLVISGLSLVCHIELKKGGPPNCLIPILVFLQRQGLGQTIHCNSMLKHEKQRLNFRDGLDLLSCKLPAGFQRPRCRTQSHGFAELADLQKILGTSPALVYHISVEFDFCVVAVILPEKAPTLVRLDRNLVVARIEEFEVALARFGESGWERVFNDAFKALALALKMDDVYKKLQEGIQNLGAVDLVIAPYGPFRKIPIGALPVTCQQGKPLENMFRAVTYNTGILPCESNDGSAGAENCVSKIWSYVDTRSVDIQKDVFKPDRSFSRKDELFSALKKTEETPALLFFCHGGSNADDYRETKLWLPCIQYPVKLQGETAEKYKERGLQHTSACTSCEYLSVLGVVGSPKVWGKPTLVIICACNSNSNYSKLAQNDCLSLCGAFFSVGVSRTIGTLWKVPALASQSLMKSLVKELKENPERSPAEALKGAQQSLAQEMGPWYWAGFVHLGAP